MQTGGSTVATMLHRLARRHNASCFVPPTGYDAHRWEFDIDPLDKALATAQTRRQLKINGGGGAISESLDMWTSHGTYSSYLHALVRGHVLVVTIVRDPVRRWLSAFDFYDLPSRRGYQRATRPGNASGAWWHPIAGSDQLVVSSSAVASSLIEVAWRNSDGGQDLSQLPSDPSPWAFNGMSTEIFGKVLNGAEEHHLAAQRIEDGSWSHPRFAYHKPGASSTMEVRNEGDTSGKVCRCPTSQAPGSSELVMVLEHFEESLVALGHFLGFEVNSVDKKWSSDLLHLGGVNRGTKVPTTLSDECMDKLRALSLADGLVYKAALRRLEKVLSCINRPNMASQKFCECQCSEEKKLVPNEGTGNSIVETSIKALARAVESAKHKCGVAAAAAVESTAQSLEKSDSDCRELIMSDADWHRRENEIIGSGEDSFEEARRALVAVLPPMASCVVTPKGMTSMMGSSEGFAPLRFACALAEYDLLSEGNFSEVAPFGEHNYTLVNIAPENACEEVAPNAAGQAALVARGGCSFRHKALVLQQAGYKAVLIADHPTETVEVTSDSGAYNALKAIPSVPSLGPVLSVEYAIQIPVFMVTDAVSKMLSTGAPTVKMDVLPQESILKPQAS